MPRRLLWLLALLPGALDAQAAVPLQLISHKWVIPPPATSTEFSARPTQVMTSPASPFEFDDHRRHGLVAAPPPRVTDRNVVLGLGLPWSDGRPPLDCAMTPKDAKCH